MRALAANNEERLKDINELQFQSIAVAWLIIQIKTIAAFSRSCCNNKDCDV